MKHNLIKSVSSFVLIVMLLFTSNLTILATGQNETQQNSVTLTLEKLTLDGGFILEPVQVTINNGESLESILGRVGGNQLVWQGDMLYAVIGAQSSADFVPSAILDMGVNENGELAPTQTSLNEIGLKSARQLGKQDYSSMSSWMCSINNQLVGSSIADYVPESGDVIRVQFSLWGNGADLGQSLGGNVPSIFTADKDCLLEALAQVRNNPYFNQFMLDPTFADIYNQAMSMAENLQASQDAVDRITDQLKILQPIPVELITLSVENVEMMVNQTYGLNLVLYPENATTGREIVWQSSNTNVAIVDENGIITGTGPGISTVSALTEIGDLSASCQVNIKAIPITGIELNNGGLALENRGTYQLSVLYFPGNTTDVKDVVWFSSDTGVVEISPLGLVTATGIGTATIMAQTASGICATCEATVAIAQELANKITEKINNLPKVEVLTLSDKRVIEVVKAEYDACPENGKNLVSDSAVEILLDLVNRMTELEINQKLANQVTEMIAFLPEPDQITLQNEEAVKSAINVFESELTREQQNLVSQETLNKLMACEKMIVGIKRGNENDLKIIMATISDLPQVSALTLMDVKQVADARKDYETLNTDQQQLVENSNVLNAAELKVCNLIQVMVARIDDQRLIADSSEFEWSLELGKAYDFLTETELNFLDIDVKDKIIRFQEKVKIINQQSNDITMDAPWYVSLQAKKIKDIEGAYTQFIQKMKKEKISSESTQLLALYSLALKDMCNYQVEYVLNSDEMITLSLPLSSDDLTYDQLSIVTQKKDGTITVINKDNYTISENRIAFKTTNTALIGLVAEKKSLEMQQSIINTEQINNLQPEIETAVEKTSSYMLVAAANPTIQSGLWETLCFARGSYAVPEGYYELFYNNVVKELEEGEGTISGDRTNTDYSKTILALTAIGKDPTNVGVYNLLSKLSNFTQIKRGGMMAYVWALIALDSNNYDIPINTTGVQTTRELLIQTILDREVVTSEGVHGGFSLYSESSNAKPDTDVTAMTLQALSRYKNKEDVKPVIDRAVNVLAGLQNSNGSYGTFGATETSESTSQVVLALTSLGIDPAIDSRFIKGDHWVLSDLMSYYVDGGGFMHIKAGATGNGGAKPGTLNGMASYQAMQAMVSYNRMKSGLPWIFAITDGFNPVINKKKNLNDIQHEYEQLYDNTKSGGGVLVAKTGGATPAGTSFGGGTVLATAASKDGIASESFTPWSFSGTYVPSSKIEEIETSEVDLIDQMNGPLMFGGVVILLTSITGMTIYLIKKKKVKKV